MADVPPRGRTQRWLILAGVSVLACPGCAFDLVRVRQRPISYHTTAATNESFVLAAAVRAKLGTGFPTDLRAGTHWRKIGTCDAGDVYDTHDQVVKVEASNIQEARIVVSQGQLVGFYLPVEATFAPLSHPLPLDLQRQPQL